ncbi:MAG: DUF1998 domain-containing protein [Gemmatales bacterium]
MRHGPKRSKPQGELRQSQTVGMYGPGAMLDLPRHSVVIGGLDHWRSAGQEITEHRLRAKLVQYLLDRGQTVQDLRLYTPPVSADAQGSSPSVGITVWLFPEWFVTQEYLQHDAKTKVQSRRLLHRAAVKGGVFRDEDNKKHQVVPVRFVRACEKGHLGDIDWHGFVHKAQTQCRRPLWMDESGTSGDLSEMRVRCECGMSRAMSDVATKNMNALGHCDGSRPWLGPLSKEKCGIFNRYLIRYASNAYFPVKLSVISLPDHFAQLEKAVAEVWEFLEIAETEADIARERKRAKVKKQLEPFTDKEVLEELLRRRRGDTEEATRSVKESEWAILSSPQDEIGQDAPESSFHARRLDISHWTASWRHLFSRVLLVHRLREVVAQVGFTRFTSISADFDGELQSELEAAPLAREISWLPVIENRGEGLFLQFSTNEIQAWLEKKAVKERSKQLEHGFDLWKQEHSSDGRLYPGAAFYLLHTFAHLLLTSISLDCGYPLSALRERVYCSKEGYGVMILTASPDAEGTLGGLIDVGNNLESHIHHALKHGLLCSNDPVCTQHDPSSLHSGILGHGAACHGCLLIAETSCEQFNNFLDRSLVVPTLLHRDMAFFPDVSPI